MKNKEKYISIWSKYNVKINEKLQTCTIKQFIQLNKKEFELVGNRKSSGYTFNLEIINGVVKDTIRHTAVARDLAKVLLKSIESKKILQSGHYKINLNKDFRLSIFKFDL